MRPLFKFSASLLLILTIFFLQTMVQDISFLFSVRFNFIFIALAICVLLYKHSTTVFWLVVCVCSLADLFSSAPFGANAIALFIGLIFLRWIETSLFSGENWHTVLLSGAFSYILYQLTALVILNIIKLFTLKIVATADLSWPNLFRDTAANVFVFTLLYFVILLATRKRRRQYVK